MNHTYMLLDDRRYMYMYNVPFNVALLLALLNGLKVPFINSSPLFPSDNIIINRKIKIFSLTKLQYNFLSRGLNFG